MELICLESSDANLKITGMKILNKREKTWIILPANQDPLKAGNVNPSTEKNISNED